MTSRNRFLIFLFSLLPLLPFSVSAFEWSEPAESSFNSLKDWHISGQNTVRYDVYDENGYKPSSIYPYDASHVYNESRLYLDRQFSQYESVSLSSAALINDSDYRSTSQGFVFEDIRASWQKGDVSVPFRVDAGDYVANLSYRTIQQNLKGAQVELQPDLKIGTLDQRHSFVGFFGMEQPDYRNMDFNRNAYAGGSWLVDMMQYGVWALHYVNNYRDKNSAEGFIEDRNQGTLGATFEKAFQVFNQKIGVEAEVNRFTGDYDSFTTPTRVEENKSDMGYFLKLSGDSGGLFDYGLRLEEYGDHFRPHGGVISANRRTLASRLGGRIYKDIRLDGRFEKYRDNLESTGRLDTNTAGLSLSGPVENPYLRDLNVYFDAFREDLDNGDRTVNVRTWSYVGDLNAAIYRKWSGHLGLNFKNADDDAFRYVNIGREYTIDVGHPVTYKGIEGDGRVGFIFGGNSGPTEGYQISPFTAWALRKNRHSLNLNIKYLMDDSRSGFGEDVSSFSISTGYAYTYGPHRFSVSLDMNNRHPYESVPYTQDYRFGVAYTFTFDKPVGTDLRDFSLREGYKPPAAVLETISAESVSPEIQILEGAAPGKTLDEVRAFLALEGLSKPSERGNFLIYETRIFRNADSRQRFVVEHKEGLVVRSAFLLDLDPSKNSAKSEETYERVRSFLLKRYHNPSAELREGDFSENYSGEINSGRLVRVTDWSAPSGQLRLGIPSRFNQPVRMEIHYAASLPNASERNWGLEQI